MLTCGNENVKTMVRKDSINSRGERLITFESRYPRMVHADFLTHRMISRNSSSSRATPFAKSLLAVETGMAYPARFVMNEKGMQGYTPVPDQALARQQWKKEVEDHLIPAAKNLAAYGWHKQIVNRILEPASHITVLQSGTEWHNYFAQRAEKGADPTLQYLAYCMLECFLYSIPVRLRDGEWHMPFDDLMPEGITLEEKIKICTARDARLSYMSHARTDIDVHSDYALHDMLIMDSHLSPLEHVAQAMPANQLNRQSGNFTGFIQYRKTIPNENRTGVDLCAILKGKPDWIDSILQEI